MQLRYSYRLFPSPGQRAALARASGCARVVFNDGLRTRQEACARSRDLPSAPSSVTVIRDCLQAVQQAVAAEAAATA